MPTTGTHHSGVETLHVENLNPHLRFLALDNLRGARCEFGSRAARFRRRRRPVRFGQKFAVVFDVRLENRDFRAASSSANFLIQQATANQKLDYRRQHFGFIFQQPFLIPYLSVLENVLVPIENPQSRRSRPRFSFIGTVGH